MQQGVLDSASDTFGNILVRVPIKVEPIVTRRTFTSISNSHSNSFIRRVFVWLNNFLLIRFNIEVS